MCTEHGGALACRLAGATRHSGTRRWTLQEEEATVVSVPWVQRCGSMVVTDGEQGSGDVRSAINGDDAVALNQEKEEGSGWNIT